MRNASTPRVRSKSRGFSLVEILTVTAILALLSAFLFPVFQSATLQARRTSDQCALRQLSAAWLMYAHDHDEHAVPSIASRSEDKPQRWIAWFGSPPGEPSGQAGLVPYLRNRVPRDSAASSLLPDPIWGVIHYAYNCAYVGGLPTTPVASNVPSSWWRHPRSLASIDVPWDTLLFCDSGSYVAANGSMQCSPWAWPPSGAAQFPPTVHARHGGKANVAFADGHACSVTVDGPQNLPMAPEWRARNIGWVVRRGSFDDSIYNGTGKP